MKKYRTRSLFQLTFIGFSVVTLPLITALGLALLHVDGMVKHSQSAIYDATHAMQLSQQLVKELMEIERYARQYLVLKDTDVWTLYLEERGEFTAIVSGLTHLPLGPSQKSPLTKLSTMEHNLYLWLSAKDDNNANSSLAAKYFTDMSLLGERLLLEGSANIQNKADSIQLQAENTKNLLIWQSIILIPVALVIALIFTILITRPLQQLTLFINGLGSGHFDIPIRITGPRDLKELGKRLEWLRRRLGSVEAQKISMLRSISHDLKTPLTALREGTELLSDNTTGSLNNQQREIANILKTNCLKLQKQIEDLLSFSATQQYLEVHTEELIVIPSLLYEVVKAHKLAIKSKGITFRGQIMDCKMIGDPKKIRVIFDNLFSNAIKYSPENGRITVCLRVRGARIVLDMEDQGPGIDPHDIDRLFDPYFQGKVTSRSPVKGSGLGLAIAQEFAKLHQGMIEVISQSVGAHFRLTLPMEN